MKLAPLLAALFVLSLAVGSGPVQAKRSVNVIPCGARDIPYWQYHTRAPGPATYRADFEARGSGSAYFLAVPNGATVPVSTGKVWQAFSTTASVRADSPNPAGVQLIATSAMCPSAGLEVRNVTVTAIP